MFNLILDRSCRVLEAAIAFCLALMVVLVFGNVFTLRHELWHHVV